MQIGTILPQQTSLEVLICIEFQNKRDFQSYFANQKTWSRTN